MDQCGFVAMHYGSAVAYFSVPRVFVLPTTGQLVSIDHQQTDV